MVGEALHDYDKELCEYAAGNARTHLLDRDFARFLSRELPLPLFTYIQDGRDPEVEQDLLLLGDGELFTLINVLSCCPTELRREWQPDEHLHRRHVNALHEV